MHEAFLANTGSTRRSSRELAGVVNALRRRFAAFRRAHKRHTRVPADLRVAVAEAMEQGVRPEALRRACSLTTQQLERWAKERGQQPVQSQGGPGDARIFSVVDDEPAVVSGGEGECGGQPLHLRVGPWSISVRLAGE
jgi:hypothetical protein